MLNLLVIKKKIMKKLTASLILLASLFSLVSCGKVASSSEEEFNPRDLSIDLTSLESEYGALVVTTDANISREDDTITIPVSTIKVDVTINGYFHGNIVISNKDNIESYKGVNIILNNACLVCDSGPVINYTLDSKNVEITSKNGTSNYIINTGSNDGDDGVYSKNNVELNGKGVLNLLTDYGHGVKSDGEIRIYQTPTINVDVGHDGLHGQKFYSNNGSGTSYLGTFNVLYAYSQAFDFTNSKGSGLMEVTSGTYDVKLTESVFKVDSTLSIGATIIASELTKAPVVKGDYSNGLRITYLSGGSFMVDGVSYTETTI